MESGKLPIQIRIEDDAMYISNECAFPSDWTVDSLLQRHQSRPYNPKIAKAFFRAGYIESWGRGIQKIVDVCNEYGTSRPEYIVHSEDIMLKLSAVRILDPSVSKLTSKAERSALSSALKILSISLEKSGSRRAGRERIESKEVGCYGKEKSHIFGDCSTFSGCMQHVVDTDLPQTIINHGGVLIPERTDPPLRVHPISLADALAYTSLGHLTINAMAFFIALNWLFLLNL